MRKILVVEKDRQLSMLLCRELEGSCSVLRASDYASAHALLRKHETDLVVMDVGIPDMDTLEAVRRVRCEHRNTGIILLSGAGHVGPGPYLETARILGANIVLAKPVSIDKLVEAANALINDSSLDSELTSHGNLLLS